MTNNANIIINFQPFILHPSYYWAILTIIGYYSTKGLFWMKLFILHRFQHDQSDIVILGMAADETVHFISNSLDQLSGWF